MKLEDRENFFRTNFLSMYLLEMGHREESY